MPKTPKKITITSLRKKAPKIPSHTCVSIDNVIEKLEKSSIDKVFVSNTVELQESEKIEKIKVFDISEPLFKYLRDFI